MKNIFTTAPRAVFWSLVSAALLWASVTVLLETGWGAPRTADQWFHRMVGWFIEFYLLRTFVRGMRRCAPAMARA